MGSRDLICRVRALYAYESNDPSSLSFKADAVIEVLAKLESGWWDGWCDGKRGWFPSNYVQVIPEEQPIQQVSEERELWELQQQWNYRQQQQQQQQQQHHHRQRVTDQEMKNQLRLSLHAADMLIPTPTPATASASQTDWIIQTTEDGSEQYFYNTQTQEMRYSMPPEGAMEEKVKQALASNSGGSSLNESYHTLSPRLEHQTFDFERPPVRPVRAANRSMMIPEDLVEYQNSPIPSSRAPSTVPTSSYHHHPPPRPQHHANIEEEEEEFEDDEKLPPNWVRKMTPKGRYYYCNIKTDETTWALENIDPDTGVLLSTLHTSATIPTSSQPHVQQETERPRTTHTNSSSNSSVSMIEDGQPTTWQSLSSLIAHAVHNLKESIQQGHTTYFGKDTTDIVHRIRLLLYVTNCLDKETSPYLKNNKQLRNHHRSLLAAVAKLVLSTKIASSAWPTPESLVKLQVDSDDILISARHFMMSAQEHGVEIKDSKPTLMHDAMDAWRHSPFVIKTSGGVLGKSDVVTATLILADNVRGAVHSFMESVRDAFSNFEEEGDLKGTLVKLKANAPLLVAQFRNLSNTTSHFLNAIEEVCQAQQNNTRSFILSKAKQPIYSSMGSLFVVSQTITSSHLDGAEQVKLAYGRLQQCVHTIETSIEDVTEATQKHMEDLVNGVADPESATTSVRNTPTPTQQRPYVATPSQQQQYGPDSGNGSDEEKHEEIARRIDIGLNTLMANPSGQSGFLLDGTLSGTATTAAAADDERSETSSIHSDFLAEMRQQKDNKITKFFGEDTIAAARRRDTITTTSVLTPTTTTSNGSGSNMGSSSLGMAMSTVTEAPWFLLTDIDPNEMIFNMEGNVKGGSLHGLVQHLTQHDQLDSKFNTTFLLTYRSFCTTEQLFNELFARYQLPPPDDLSAEELEIWKEKKLKLVRLRVFNVIKSWLETYFNEEEDKSILPEINHFTDHVIVESMKFGAEQLSKVIKKRMMSEDSGQIRKMKLNVRTADMPAPILPKNMKRIKLLEIDPLELARQMTVMDFRLYNRIKPVECLDKNWGKPDTDDGLTHIAANVKASIEHSNQVTAWVTDSILSKEEIKKRVVVLKHWISVAERCRLLNNYNTCMAILSAFDNGSIGRLKRTWEVVGARSMQTLQNIRRLMGANRNFSEYRDIIHKVNPPCIPFLGIYLQDLTFIEDGNSNFLKKSNNLINFAKRMKTAEVIRDLQQYQSTHYMLTAVPDIQEFIKTHLHSSREEEELYNLSLKLEPRERGEDTIARRLKESGL